MAQKKSDTEEAQVTRIKAGSSSSKKQTTKPSVEQPKAVEVTKKTKTKKRSEKTLSFRAMGKPFAAIGRYFGGAWFELKQVRWPTRRATWSLTFAVLLYSAFFVVLVLLLDALFRWLFELVIGK